MSGKRESQHSERESEREREEGNGRAGVMVTTTTILEPLPNLVGLVVATLWQGVGDPERSR